MTIEITPDGEYIATDKFASLYQEHWKEIVPCECGAPWIPAIQICERGLHRLKDELSQSLAASGKPEWMGRMRGL